MRPVPTPMHRMHIRQHRVPIRVRRPRVPIRKIRHCRVNMRLPILMAMAGHRQRRNRTRLRRLPILMAMAGHRQRRNRTRPRHLPIPMAMAGHRQRRNPIRRPAGAIMPHPHIHRALLRHVLPIQIIQPHHRPQRRVMVLRRRVPCPNHSRWCRVPRCARFRRHLRRHPLQRRHRHRHRHPLQRQ